MEIATEIFGMQGIEILQAWNGEEAVETFKASASFEIDQILIDMHMPINAWIQSGAKYTGFYCLRMPKVSLF